MIVENSVFIMQGLGADDPGCILTAEEMEAFILKVGFLPLFANDVSGFSVEEHASSDAWWTGDEETDPWEWRGTITRRGNVVYGKFFDGKAGFISKEWLPIFASYRRDGYDFDSRQGDELTTHRQDKIMSLFMDENDGNELFGPEIKEQAGFSKGGEKGYEGTLTSLEMMTYLVVKDFKQRINKKGKEYGWHLAVLCTPEHIYGRDLVASAYTVDPKECLERIISRVKEISPDADDDEIMRLVSLPEDKPKIKKKSLPYPQNVFHAIDKETDPSAWNQDQVDGLYVALGQLRPKLQRVARMKYIEGLTNEEIGRKMNRAAGTISTYVRKVSDRLRDPLTAEWYLRGYKDNLQACAIGRNWSFSIPEPGDEISLNDLCLRIGLKVQHFEALQSHSIVTVADLLEAMKQPNWNKGIKGIGTRTVEDIEQKLNDFGFKKEERRK